MISTICTNAAITRMNDKVWRYCKPNGSSTYFCTSHVMMVAKVKTKAMAPPIPMAVSIFFDTPKNGQIPRN